MKGIFNLNPPTRKFGFVWDVKVLFDYFEKMGDNNTLNDKNLSQKLLALLILLGGQRLNTVHQYQVNEMIKTEISITFAPSNLLKHSKQHSKLDVFEYRKYHNKKLCVVDCLNTYLDRRQNKVDNTVQKLFISHQKPYKAVSIDTLRRWMKNLF